MHNGMNSVLCAPNHLGNFPFPDPTFMQFPNFPYFCFCKARFAACLSFGAIPPFFLHHINMIVMACAQEQMGWVATWRVVARMTNLDAHFYRPLCKYPGPAMGKKPSPLSLYGRKELPIAILVALSLPFPALPFRALSWLFADCVPEALL